MRWSISGLALTTFCHHISSLALGGGPLGSLQLPACLCPDDDDDYLDYEPTTPKPMYATTYFYLCNERNSHLLYFSAVFSFRYIPQHSPTTKPIASIDRHEERERGTPLFIECLASGNILHFITPTQSGPTTTKTIVDIRYMVLQKTSKWMER